MFEPLEPDPDPIESSGKRFVAPVVRPCSASSSMAPPRLSDPLGDAPVGIPDYLRDVYAWAYLNPFNVQALDRAWIVNAILWGNSHRLQRALFDELRPDWRILQASHVYGDLLPRLARFLGPKGRLEVIDIAPIQVEYCRRKLQDYPVATVRLDDAARPGGGPYDAVSCFFLLHEIPLDYKRAVVNALLGTVKPGGKVVFIDYHRPSWWHPLRGLMSLVFDSLEPFAKELWETEIEDFAEPGRRFTWSKETFFGGLYQKTVARSPRTARN